LSNGWKRGDASTIYLQIPCFSALHERQGNLPEKNINGAVLSTIYPAMSVILHTSYKYNGPDRSRHVDNQGTFHMVKSDHTLEPLRTNGGHVHPALS
jgi:hypothetical protein